MPVFNIRVINNPKRCTRPVAVKRRWGFVQTECNFSLLLLHGRAGCVINCSRQRGIYEQVQMEVTSDLSRGVRRALKPQDCGAFRQSASLFLISSNRILFPKCGINHATSGKCAASVPEIVMFLPFPSFSPALGSKCQPGAIQTSHPASPECLQVLLKSYVRQSVGSVWRAHGFMRGALRGLGAA